MMTQANESKAQPEAAKSQMAWMFLASIVIATANTLLYKAALNAFSSPTTNYAFFASQFSILLYVFQALLFSIFIVARDWNSITELFRIPQSVYLLMGFLDSASGTLGAIAGANCPGGIQTVLNQLIIPITMVGASFFLNAKFETSQLWGSAFIVLGAVVASSGYMYSSADASSEGSNQPSIGGGEGPSTAAVSTAVVSAAVVLYFISVIPSAMSNIYKEGKMKEQDMSEVHTSTVVSFWQLWFGFLFLPLMSLPQLGGLTFKEMSSQLSDGFTCFMGTNPGDPNADCSNAAYLLLAYITVNFFYNILMLAITKRGSAVLLVIAQALSLPVTNIAFTLRIFMGDDAEPLTALNLLGLVLVCIGFLTYSGFGLASNFMVAQGPPGQMAYVHFDDVSELIVSTEMALRPEQLVNFLVQATFQQQTTQLNRGKTPEGSHKTGDGRSPRTPLGGYSSILDLAEKPASQRVASSGNLELGNGEETPLIHSGHSSGTALAVANEPTQLTASREALRVARLAVLLLEDRVSTLEQQDGDPCSGQKGSCVDTGSNSSSNRSGGAALEMNARSVRK